MTDFTRPGCSDRVLACIIIHDFKVRRFTIQLQMGVKIRYGPFTLRAQNDAECGDGVCSYVPSPKPMNEF